MGIQDFIIVTHYDYLARGAARIDAEVEVATVVFGEGLADGVYDVAVGEPFAVFVFVLE
jgi:hypothetical protein